VRETVAPGACLQSMMWNVAFKCRTLRTLDRFVWEGKQRALCARLHTYIISISPSLSCGPATSLASKSPSPSTSLLLCSPPLPATTGVRVDDALSRGRQIYGSFLSTADYIKIAGPASPSLNEEDCPTQRDMLNRTRKQDNDTLDRTQPSHPRQITRGRCSGGGQEEDRWTCASYPGDNEG
jgi:hypothetical protein